MKDFSLSPPPPTAHADASRPVMRVLALTLTLNLLNCLIKFTVGFAGNNLTIISDAVHGLLDAGNNVIGMLTTRLAWRPPDANHPYGHRKYEALAALAIGGLMGLTSWEILRTIGAKHLFGDPGPSPRFTLLFMILLVVSLVLNVFITIYERRRGRALKSPLLLADAAHTRVDIYVTLFSVLSLAVAPLIPWVDGLLAAVVVGFILYTGWTVVRDNVLLLTDAVQLDPEPIRREVEAIEEVENCHAVRSHGMPDEVHLDLHIVIPPDLTAQQAQEIEARVRERLLSHFPEVAEVSIHHQTHPPRTEQPIRRETLSRNGGI